VTPSGIPWEGDHGSGPRPTSNYSRRRSPSIAECIGMERNGSSIAESETRPDANGKYVPTQSEDQLAS
jgi:hypothetical protein